jgi:hypothetical protein
MNVPYKLNDNADITISGTFKKKEEDDDSAAILYTAFIFFNLNDNTVYAYEKAVLNGQDISTDPSFKGLIVKKDESEGAMIPIGTVLATIAGIVASFGAIFRRTDNEQLAKYPDGYIPASVDANASSTGFCTSCGAKMPVGTRFCTNCGADSKAAPVQQAKPFVSNDVPPVYANANMNQKPVPNPAFIKPNIQSVKPRRKVPVAVIAIAVVLTIGVLATGGILIRNWILNKKPNDNTNITNPTASSSPNSNPSALTGSSIVSVGVNYSDLGNIMNGQYYFATDDYVFYSSYDADKKAHIYRMDKDGTDFKSIFNGFGWSLVVIEDWLYFSGNQGDAIDGSYNIYRMKLDGSSVERINNTYSYGMFLYGDYLYYMKRSPDYTDAMSICRSLLDGTEEEVLAEYGNNPVIYDDMLYYYDGQGNMYRSNPDGSNLQVLLTSRVGFYVLSDEKITYKDFSSNIYICDLDGSNNELVRAAQDKAILTVNAYDGRIYFIQYDLDNYNYSTYSWPYDLVSIKTDGTDEKIIFSSSSYGMYLNIVSSRLMLMDYKYDIQTGLMYTDINSMNIDGSDLRMLAR